MIMLPATVAPAGVRGPALGYRDIALHIARRALAVAKRLPSDT